MIDRFKPFMFFSPKDDGGRNQEKAWMKNEMAQDPLNVYTNVNISGVQNRKATEVEEREALYKSRIS
jgi:hypothetical protein